jgi:hypothetical protein
MGQRLAISAHFTVWDLVEDNRTAENNTKLQKVFARLIVATQNSYCRGIAFYRRKDLEA